MKPRGTAANKLSDILQMLQLARRTGLLEVERVGAGNVIEQGSIKLQLGQIVEANLGAYTGAAALDMLLKWTACYFTFHASTGSGSLTLQAPVPRSPVTNELRSATGPITGPISGAPYRIYAVEEALPLFASRRLTRVHRQLFLLIDGQRTPQQLARLTGRPPGEVEALLADLERANFIRQP
jgi:hypothetical protein